MNFQIEKTLKKIMCKKKIIKIELFFCANEKFCVYKGSWWWNIDVQNFYKKNYKKKLIIFSVLKLKKTDNILDFIG